LPPDAFERTDEAGTDEVPPLAGHGVEEIQPNRVVEIGGVEIYDVIRSPGRDMVEKFIGQIAVRVDDADAFTGFDVLENQIPEKRRFASPGFSDHVDVLTPVGTSKTERFSPAPNISCSRLYDVIAHFLNQTSTPSFHFRSSVKVKCRGNMRFVSELPG